MVFSRKILMLMVCFLETRVSDEYSNHSGT